MLGSIIGDIAGSVFEHNNRKTKDFGPLFGARSHFTDDTVCTIAIAQALVSQTDPAQALRTWGRRYHVGYGFQFSNWLGSDTQGPYNSFGNGSAMRVSPACLLANSVEHACALAHATARVTHNHPEGMKGAAAVAVAGYLARTGSTPSEIRREVAHTFGYNMTRSVNEIRLGYSFDETCQGSVPQALTCALEARDFEDAIRNAISIGGDSDTVAAIAGGVAEALFGIPEDLVLGGWAYLPKPMQTVLCELYAQAGQPLAFGVEVAPDDRRAPPARKLEWLRRFTAAFR